VSPATILLVDDEPALLQLLEKHLLRLGYRVETQSTAGDALRSFEADPARFDLIIADLTLPDMSGQAMLTRMLAVKPTLLILICSGLPFLPSGMSDLPEKQVAFLQKPFLPKMLSEAMERLLS
jgi:DNA-binding NtrC family response regulator